MKTHLAQTPIPEQLQDRLREPSLTGLLAVQFLSIFIVGPLEEDGVLGRWAVRLCLILLALISIFVVARGSVARWLIVFSILVMLGGSAVETLISPAVSWPLVSYGAALLFNGTVTWVVLRALFRDGRVTIHRIQGGIVVYLNIALIFALLYGVGAQLLSHPFTKNSIVGPHHLGELIYFSLCTLTTASFGDVVPLHPLLRSLANLESVIGQLFPATLIAGLIGLHLTERQRHGIRRAARSPLDS